nr:hypothetical protein [Herbaspirillum frisingense]
MKHAFSWKPGEGEVLSDRILPRPRAIKAVFAMVDRKLIEKMPYEVGSIVTGNVQVMIELGIAGDRLFRTRHEVKYGEIFV